MSYFSRALPGIASNLLFSLLYPLSARSILFLSLPPPFRPSPSLAFSPLPLSSLIMSPRPSSHLIAAPPVAFALDRS